MFNTIPCPDTRAKALTEPSYAVRRNGPKDQGTDLRLSLRTPSNRKPPPATGGQTAALREIFEKNRDGSSARRNLNPSPKQSNLGPPTDPSELQQQTFYNPSQHFQPKILQASLYSLGSLTDLLLIQRMRKS